MQTIVTYQEEEFLEFYNKYLLKYDIIDCKIIINDDYIYMSIYAFIFWLSQHDQIMGLRHKDKDILLLTGNTLEICYHNNEYSYTIIIELNEKMLSSVDSIKKLQYLCYGTQLKKPIGHRVPCRLNDLPLFKYQYPINCNFADLTGYFDTLLFPTIVYNLDSEKIVQTAIIGINLKGGINDTFKDRKEEILNYIKDNICIDNNFIVFPDSKTYGVSQGTISYPESSFIEIRILCAIFPRLYYQRTIGYDYDILNGFKNSFKDIAQIQQWIKNRWNIVTEEANHEKICNLAEELIRKSIFSSDYVCH